MLVVDDGPGEAIEQRWKDFVELIAHEIAHHFGISDERLLEIDAY